MISKSRLIEEISSSLDLQNGHIKLATNCTVNRRRSLSLVFGSSNFLVSDNDAVGVAGLDEDGQGEEMLTS
jgi:hypothetical protein